MNEINQVQEKTTDEQNDSLIGSNARRRLIKGTAVALPVVMTLRSGAAMALTSTDQCTAKDQDQASKLHDDNKLPKFRNNDPNTVETFYRVPVLWVRFIKIIEVIDPIDSNNNFWIYDKKSPSGGLKKANAYKHDLSDTPEEEWMSTGGVTQKIFAAQGAPDIDVYDSETTGPGDGGAIQITGEHFIRTGNKHYVFETNASKFGLVMTDDGGVPLTDLQLGVRVGKIVDSGVLLSNHITGSCMCSINPTTP